MPEWQQVGCVAAIILLMMFAAAAILDNQDHKAARWQFLLWAFVAALLFSQAIGRMETSTEDKNKGGVKMSKNRAVLVNIDEHAKAVALEAVRIYRKEESDKVRRSGYHNMRTLMENYLDLVEHYEKIKYRAKDLEDYLENMDIYGVDSESEDGEIRIEAIKRSKTRTLIMVTQIQAAVEMIKRDMEAKNEVEKYLTVTMLYMDQSNRGMKFTQKVQMVAEDVKCDPVTIRRWNNEMLNKLAVKLFGVDGLKLDI